MVKKIFVAKTSKGTYYVQRMPGIYDDNLRYVLFKNRRQCYWVDFNNEKAAVQYMLELLQRELVAQGSLEF